MRETGYYWVLFDEESGWEVAYYNTAGWHSMWAGGIFTDDELIEINEERVSK